MIKRNILIVLLLAGRVFPAMPAPAGEIKEVKNLIVLIPDGTSLQVLSAARWLQWYKDPDKPNLHLDPFLCGTVSTYSSNAPIGDSAPTTSCYMTGYPSRTGYVSTYPEADPQNDLLWVDPARARQPLITLLEAARMARQKSVGLVFTCEFPHATPADCSAHSYQRSRYDWIAPQMVHNDLAVVIGGGTSFLSKEDESYLIDNGYNVYKDNLQGMRACTNNRMWALFGQADMAYDLDRDTAQQPSLEEMTRTALAKLCTNDSGFVLMVEGSKVDWAAHANDPAGMITDFLAFDRACGVALDFAKTNAETAVVIVPDHGNSGMSIGNASCPGYDRLTKDQLFGALARIELTAEGLANKVNNVPYTQVQDIFRTYAGFELLPEELEALYRCQDYTRSPIPVDQRTGQHPDAPLYGNSLAAFMARLIQSKTCFGFTTNGHTGEEVFLAAYHPQGTLPLGRHTNVELHRYLCALLGLTGRLDQLTGQMFVPHSKVFKDFPWEIIPAHGTNKFPTLVVKNPKKQDRQLTIHPFTNIVGSTQKGDAPIRLQSVVVYVDKDSTFYLPTHIVDYIR